jgi:adenosylmethionine-8-amino-7-oxononanoate aminotransferase
MLAVADSCLPSNWSRTRRPRILYLSLRDRIVDLAFQRGLLLLGCGETSIRLCPSLLVRSQEADIALDILEECIQLGATADLAHESLPRYNYLRVNP